MRHTVKISLQICGGGSRFAAQTNFGPPPPRAKLEGIPGARSPNNGRSVCARSIAFYVPLSPL
jgi:hypothetical protein